MKKISGILIALLLVIVSLFGVVGCGVGSQSGLPSNTDEKGGELLQTDLQKSAVFFDKAEKWATEEFLVENETHFFGIHDGLPDYLCFSIETNNEFTYAFDSFPQEIDFSQYFIIVYFFTDIYYGFDCKLQTITKNKGEVSIEVLHEMAGKEPGKDPPPSTSFPTQRCLVVKMPNCEYTSVKVEMLYP